MKKIFILRILDLFSFLFENSNIDYQNVRLILQLKFYLDRRRIPAGFQNWNVNPEKDQNLFVFAMIIDAIFGVMFAIMMAFISNVSPFMSFIIFFTIVMAIMIYATIIEFSLDMFDISDREIILPKPVTSQEINLAKNLHILFYMLGMAFAFGLPTIIYWGFHSHFFVALASIFSIVFATFFLFFIMAIFYALLLKKFSGEKLKDVINFVQIMTILGMFFGYQIFLFFSPESIKMNGETIRNLLFLFPPTWFAMPSYLFVENGANSQCILTAIFGIAVAIFGYVIYLKKLAPDFEKNLYRLTLQSVRLKKKKPPIATIFKGIFRNHIMQSFYQFSVIMLRGERKTKQAIYPTLVLGIILPIMPLIMANFNTNSPFGSGKSYFFLYYCLFIMIPLSVYTNMSDSYQAAWIYRFLPVRSPGQIIKSAHFAMFFTYQGLIFLIPTIFYLYFWKFQILEHILVILLNSLILQLFYYDMAGLKLPFSEEVKTGQNNAFQQINYLLTIFIFTPLAIGLHYVFTIFSYGIFLFIAIQFVYLWYLYRKLYHITWADLQSRQIKKKKKKK